MIDYLRKYTSKILVHLLFWMLFIFVSLFVFSPYYWSENPFLQYVIILIVIVYVNTTVLLPLFIKKKWYLFYTLVFLAISFLATQLYCYVFAKCGCSIMKCLSDYLWQTLVPLIFFSFTWMLFSYLDKKEELEKSIQDLTAMELQILKSQINPHVLFNNLNTIYAYAIEKPHETPDLILKLSNNLKYVLYESNTTYVSLDKELLFITNYIAFQKIRTEGLKTINFSNTILKTTHVIAPLLLITIIENAFKYSTLNSTIDIAISQENNYLTCTCVNEFESPSSASENIGIGLLNLRKRLALLYKNKHMLQIERKPYFSVNLKIELR